MLHHFSHLSIFRKTAGLTQSQLANKLNVGQPNIARLEKNPELASLQQVENWLKACNLVSNVQLNISSFAEEITSDTKKLQIAKCMEELFKSKGVDVNLKNKPLFAVCTNEDDDFELQTCFVRTLLNFGDKLFFGYYLPSRYSTILWKHVSERPYHMSDNVYVLNGSLEPWMRNSPTQHLPIANCDGIEKKGGFWVASEYDTNGNNDSENKIVVVYADHPLLHCFDLLQVPLIAYEKQQSFQNLRMLVEAEITAVCIQGRKLSNSTLLISIAMGRIFDFIISPEEIPTDEIEKNLKNLYSYENGEKYILVQHNSRGICILNTDATDRLKQLTNQCFNKINNRILGILGGTTSGSDTFATVTKPDCLAKDKNSREVALLKLSNVENASYPLSIRRLLRVFAVMQALVMPRLNNLKEINESNYAGIDSKATESERTLLGEFDLKKISEQRDIIPEHVLKKIREIAAFDII